MQIARSVEELREIRRGINGTVGFVPTMGALHSGHLSLIKEAKKQCDFVIVSVFVNPTQFLANEDFGKYPRKEQADEILCRASGADLLFLPNASEIYGSDEPSIRAPKTAGFVLEGSVRAGHFDGVLSVVLKLLNLTGANKAFFGKKDAQQLVLISQMAKAFFLPVEIVACETIREQGGLAMSSRNEYLEEAQKNEAKKLSFALYEASRLIKQNVLDSSVIKAKMSEVLAPLSIDYIEVVDRDLKPIKTVVSGGTIVLIAARIGGVRLIDNMWV